MQQILLTSLADNSMLIPNIIGIIVLIYLIWCISSIRSNTQAIRKILEYKEQVQINLGKVEKIQDSSTEAKFEE